MVRRYLIGKSEDLEISLEIGANWLTLILFDRIEKRHFYFAIGKEELSLLIEELAKELERFVKKELPNTVKVYPKLAIAYLNSGFVPL